MVKKATSPLPPAGPPWQASHATYLAGAAHLDGVDALAVQMEGKWGVGRLRLLVAPDLREKFDRQRLKLNEAITGGGVADVQREAGRMVNAWLALDAAAEAASKHPLAPVVWEVRLPDGSLVALVRTPEEAHAVARDSGREMKVFTIDEVARLLHGFPELAKAKETWPGAVVSEVRRPTDPLENWEALGDAVPDFAGG